MDRAATGTQAASVPDGRSMPMSETQKSLALLIPGLDGTGLLYYRQLQSLARHFRALPFRFRERAGFDYADLVAELSEVTADEPPGSVTVVGESFGGTVALHYALAHPDKVRRLLLVNTFARYPGRIRIRLGILVEPLLRHSVFRALKDRVVDGILRREGIPAEDRAEYGRIITQVNRAAYRRRLELVRDLDLRKRLPEIRVPTVIFTSGRDRIVPSSRAARVMAALIPKATVHEFPRAGHALLLTPGFQLADYEGNGKIQMPDTTRNEEDP